jgi:hypothetical protein
VSGLVVDTSSWISYFTGRRADSIDDALEEGRVYMPPLVAAELASGRLGKKRRADLEDLIRHLPLCDCDVDHWIRVGRLRASLAEHGLTVSTPDAHVAQCALDLSADLLTEDGIFARITEHAPLRLERVRRV